MCSSLRGAWAATSIAQIDSAHGRSMHGGSYITFICMWSPPFFSCTQAMSPSYLTLIRFDVSTVVDCFSRFNWLSSGSPSMQ